MPDVVGVVVQLPLVDQLPLAPLPNQVVIVPADAVPAAAMQARVSSPRESGLNERRIMIVAFSWDAGTEADVDWADGALSQQLSRPPSTSNRTQKKDESTPARTISAPVPPPVAAICTARCRMRRLPPAPAGPGFPRPRESPTLRVCTNVVVWHGVCIVFSPRPSSGSGERHHGCHCLPAC